MALQLRGSKLKDPIRMPHLYQFSPHFPYLSGIPRDVSINVWNVGISDELAAVSDDLTAAFDTIGAAIIGFYNTVHGTASIASTMSNFIDRAHCYGILTEVSDAALTPGAGAPTFTPIGTRAFALGAGEPSNDLPLEVSIVASLRGLEVFPGATFPPSIRRRRGRLYCGPFNTGVMTSDVGGRPTIQESVRNDIAAACRNTAIAIDAVEGAAWVVWSRAARGMAIITEGYCNDDADTQRRRGSGETARSSWSV